MEQRFAGSLLGLACGDAVGAAVEFCQRGTFPEVTDMIGGGPFRLAPGQWTDDTSMALCLAESLLERQGFDARDQMARYLNWWRWGYWSSTGTCFDIGATTRAALHRFELDGNPFAGSADPSSAGNGSLMRLAPVVLSFYPSRENVLQYAVDSSRTTHAANEALDCCRALSLCILNALCGRPKSEILEGIVESVGEPRVLEIATGGYRHKSRDEIRGSGYAVESLEAALWCFDRANTFEEAVLLAANLGDDADTTAAVVGQLAGAYYGVQGIPERWKERVHSQAEIRALANRLHSVAMARGSTREDR